MALTSAVAWEVRTGGSDSNGGGYTVGAGGTDYSQQNAAQVVFNGSTITATYKTGSSFTVTKAMFGEMAIIDENPRSASIQAVVPTVCTVITRKVFEEQLRHIPPWMVGMIKILVMRLREANDRLRNIIEQSGPTLPADTGRVITVDEDVAAPKDGRQSQPSSDNSAAPGVDRHYKSEDIVKDLYK